MKIVVDAMGGDQAPAVVVAGAVAEARARGTQIILVGMEDRIRAELAKQGDTSGLPIEIVHASEVVEMAEHTLAVKAKKDSSLAVGMRLVKEGKADAFASAGNSGAVMAAALFGLGRIRGVERPALSSIYPAAPEPCLIIDIGANADCKPEYLVQFAVMGHAYARVMFGLEQPKIGIISNGEEEDKGSMLVRETYPLLKASGLNFVGNVEGKDIGKGLANVVVTDGLTGNVIVKLTEGCRVVSDQDAQAPAYRGRAQQGRPGPHDPRSDPDDPRLGLVVSLGFGPAQARGLARDRRRAAAGRERGRDHRSRPVGRQSNPEHDSDG